MSGTVARIDPNVVDASGALKCARASLDFTVAAEQQMQILAYNAERGLRGRVPAVREALAFRAAIAEAAATGMELVKEHVRHALKQHELAQDENLRTAAIGYLDSLNRI